MRVIARSPSNIPRIHIGYTFDSYNSGEYKPRNLCVDVPGVHCPILLDRSLTYTTLTCCRTAITTKIYDVLASRKMKCPNCRGIITTDYVNVRIDNEVLQLGANHSWSVAEFLQHHNLKSIHDIRGREVIRDTRMSIIGVLKHTIIDARR